MKTDLKIRNIVLIGAFNPLVFDKFYFVKNKITKEEDILDKSIFLPEIVQLVTPSFQLTINNLQLIINAGTHEKGNDEIANVLVELIRLNTDFKITGSGFNFSWFVTENISDKTLNEFTKELCFNPTNKIQSAFFNDDDATFGFYSSKNIMNTRLKLDVKPIKFRLIGKSEEESALQFEFNFHKDYKDADNSKVELTAILSEYLNYWKETEKIINTIN